MKMDFVVILTCIVLAVVTPSEASKIVLNNSYNSISTNVLLNKHQSLSQSENSKIPHDAPYVLRLLFEQSNHSVHYKQNNKSNQFPDDFAISNHLPSDLSNDPNSDVASEYETMKSFGLSNSNFAPPLTRSPPIPSAISYEKFQISDPEMSSKLTDNCPTPNNTKNAEKYAQCVMENVKQHVENMKTINQSPKKSKFCEDSKQKVLEDIPSVQKEIKIDVARVKKTVARIVACGPEQCDSCPGLKPAQWNLCRTQLEVKKQEQENDVISGKKQVDLLKDQAEALDGYCLEVS